MKPRTLHPNAYAALHRRVHDSFDRLSKVELGIAALALPLLTLRWTTGARWAEHAFVALAVLALGMVLVQAVLLAGCERANHWAGEWYLAQEAEKAKKAVATQPRKGFRVPAGHDPCPCGSGQRYRSCCRPRHQMRPAG